LKLTSDSKGLNVQEFDGFKDFMVIYSKDECQSKVHIFDFNTNKVEDISFNSVGEIYPGLN